MQQVVVRRLKSEINARKSPPRFSDRKLKAVELSLSPEERTLSEAFEGFRRAVHKLVATSRKTDRLAGAFAVEVLAKRLLSCPTSFADSWHRYRSGMTEDEPARPEEVRAAERSYREDTGDDRESEGRTAHAARTVGAWLKPLSEKLTAEVDAIHRALKALGLDDGAVPPATLDPKRDARFDALEKLLEEMLRHNDERLVVFTEYKTTLDYLERRLKAIYPKDGLVRVLFGGMSDDEREEIKLAFNDPKDPVRILVATDAASEGLNLQETARTLLHYDIPWNPARLEQRNGRLDRHGQARDVLVHHFATDQDADLDFLAYVAGKVETIREDLGATGEVFDAALARRLIEGEETAIVQEDLERRLAIARGRAEVPRGTEEDTGEEELRALRALASEIDLDAESLKGTLDVAMGLNYRRPYLEGPDSRGRFRLGHPVPPHWQELVDDVLRLDGRKGPKGALPSVVFDPKLLIKDIGGRPVFRPEPDTALLHLGHPVFHQALARFARARFPGAMQASRWTVSRGPVPENAEALVLLTVEELAVNDLRETFHHWIETLEIPVRKGEFQEVLPHRPAEALRVPATALDDELDELKRRARRLWDEIASDAKALLEKRAEKLTLKLRAVLKDESRTATDEENDRFQKRQGEVSSLIAQTTMERLEKEIESLKVSRDQGFLFDQEERLVELERSIESKEEERRRRLAHYEELRQQLEKERERVIRHLLPKRYALHGEAQVFPVAVEIRFPERAS